MPLLTINGTDKLESGFRSKFNNNAQLLITGFTDNGDGTVTVTLFGGGSLPMALTGSFYTKSQVNTLVAPATAQATYTTLGLVSIATLLEVNAGATENKVVVPFTAKYSTLFPFKGDFEVRESDPSNPDYEPGYTTGDVVVNDDILYRSITDNNYGDVLDEAFWTSLTPIPTPLEPISDTSDANGEFDVISYGIGDFPTVTIYDSDGIQSPAQYDNTNKKIIGLNPSSNFTARFI
jgi:hypothetical protein